MATSIELRNEAREALSKAIQTRDEGKTPEGAWKDGEQAKFAAYWKEYTDKDKAASALGEEEELVKYATDKYDWKPTDIRNPAEAKLDILPADKAKEGVRLADGSVVMFASDKSEGWIKGYTASVQHPEIIRRLTPELKMAAQLENDAFCKWFRYGIR